MAVPCAQLRVFVPRDTLDDKDVERWTRPVGRRAALALERDAVESRLLGGRGGVDDRAVLVRRRGEERFLCPVLHDLRAGLALRQLAEEVPTSVLDALVPDQGLRDHLSLVAAGGRRPTIVDAPWAVPLPWFGLFAPTDRRFSDPAEGAGPRLVHITTVAAASTRLVRLVDVLDGRLEEADEVLDALADLTEWVDAFDPRSLLELDYAGLLDLLGAAAAARDTSCADLWAAVDALDRGDLVEAARSHASLRRRWRGPRALSSSS